MLCSLRSKKQLRSNVSWRGSLRTRLCIFLLSVFLHNTNCTISQENHSDECKITSIDQELTGMGRKKCPELSIGRGDVFFYICEHILWYPQYCCIHCFSVSLHKTPCAYTTCQARTIKRGSTARWDHSLTASVPLLTPRLPSCVTLAEPPHLWALTLLTR